MVKSSPKLICVKKSFLEEFIEHYPYVIDIISTSFTDETVIVVDEKLSGVYVSCESGKYKGVMFVGSDSLRWLSLVISAVWHSSIVDGCVDFKLFTENLVNELS